MAADGASRAAERARKMVFAKSSSFAEHAEQGVAFWQSVPLSDKFEAMVELVRDSWYLQGNDGPLPRLDRSAHGVPKLQG